MELFATTIVDATYHKADLDKVINNQKNLMTQEQKKLCRVFIKLKKIIQWNTWCLSTQKGTHRAVRRCSH